MRDYYPGVPITEVAFPAASGQSFFRNLDMQDLAPWQLKYMYYIQDNKPFMTFTGI